MRRDFTGHLFPAGQRLGADAERALDFNASIGTSANTENGGTEEGSDTLIALPERRADRIPAQGEHCSRTLLFRVGRGWDYNGGANRTAHLNGRYAHDYFALTQANDVFPAVGATRNDRLTQRYYQSNYEIGGDVTRPLWGGGIKLIGLATRRDRDRTDVQFNRINSVILGGASQGLVDQRDETRRAAGMEPQQLGRLVGRNRRRGAFNRLDSNVDLVSSPPAGRARASTCRSTRRWCRNIAARRSSTPAGRYRAKYGSTWA